MNKIKNFNLFLNENLKARQIKKIRNKLGKIQTYTIQETAGLFGDFDGNNRLGLIKQNKKVSASSPIRAIEIYMKNYRKENKKKNEYERDEYLETTEKWAYLKVTDEDGFSYYYK